MTSPKGVLVGHCRSRAFTMRCWKAGRLRLLTALIAPETRVLRGVHLTRPLDPLVCPTAGRLCRWRGPTFPPATKPSKNFLALAFSVDFNLLQQSAEPNKT